ncbi:MAG: putative DNA binding domain-containing protein [Candidatus Sericytochromatia bacterium]|nr:putative DNA binding domain-containing protein [Candidatus Sericytochromatia bacterium]
MSHNLDLSTLLTHLIAGWESEVVEFKEAGKDYDTDKIGRYFSVLSNEANLHERDAAWLVFGVQDKTRQIVGSAYRPEAERLQAIKEQIKGDTEPGVTFRQIHELQHPAGRVILFEIPPAPRGIPIAWKGHFYARSGESLGSLGYDKQDAIRNQTLALDWSAQIVPGATLADLDAEALAAARQAFISKQANNQRLSAAEILSWSDQTFLERARLTLRGQLTRATVLLLGKRESASLLNPHLAEITWRLMGEERGYQHFGPPFLLNTTEIYRKIRNFPIRLLPNNSLLPIEIPKYEQKLVLEALHNCIAHQDYSRHARIIVSEYTDRLTFENDGAFFEGQPDDYLSGDKTPQHYRNPFLVQAMSELNMIDTMGHGIYLLHKRQAARFLPLPDYDLSEPCAVKMTLYGNVVDIAYSRLLMEKTDLSLTDILALDRVQKQLPVAGDMLRRLRKAGLVEGRKPHLHISAQVAQVTEDQASYMHMRSQDDAFYMRLILDYITKFEKATRKEIDALLRPKLGDILTEEQKMNKIGNLLTSLRRSKQIKNTGSRKKPEWHLVADAESFAE